MYVAAKLGIADHLTRGPMRADELAKEVGAQPQSTPPTLETFDQPRHIHAG